MHDYFPLKLIGKYLLLYNKTWYRYIRFGETEYINIE
jgi:hypothetical protein